MFYAILLILFNVLLEVSSAARLGWFFCYVKSCHFISCSYIFNKTATYVKMLLFHQKKTKNRCVGNN